MKPQLILITIIILNLTSCTDVVDVEVQTSDPKLTIEASLDWEKGTLGNVQTVILSRSSDYFDHQNNSGVIGAVVSVTNDSSGADFIFEDQGNGEYTTSSFVPELNQSYTLFVEYENETYMATETMQPVTDISELYQSTEKGIDDEALEINVSFIDPADQNNYYLIKIHEHGEPLVKLFDVKDEFTNGNEISLYYEKLEDTETNTTEFEPGDVVDLELLGISESYYNYISILIAQNDSDGLFNTTPVQLKGNCVNLNNSENNAYGFFRLTQFVKESHTFE